MFHSDVYKSYVYSGLEAQGQIQNFSGQGLPQNHFDILFFEYLELGWWWKQFQVL